MTVSSAPCLIIIVCLIFFTNSITFPHIIWTYWHSGWENDVTLQSFIMNKQRFLTDDWELRALNSSSLQKWIILQQGPQNFRTIQVYADYIRLSLLEKYGGVWIDFTTILLQDFTWLENLQKNPDVQNKKGLEPNVFVFTLQDYGPNIHLEVSPTQTVNLYPGEDHWFIAAKKQAVLIQEWLKEFKTEMQFIKKKKLVERTLKILSEQGIILNNCGTDQNSEFSHQYAACCTAFHIVMHRKQKQLDEKYGKNVKFQAHEYGLWSMDAVKNGPMTLYRLYPPWKGQLSTFKLLKALTMADETLLFSKYPQLKYFIKIQASFTKVLPLYMSTSIWLPIQHMKIDFTYILWSLFKLIDPTQMKIKENSITHKYLLFNQTFTQSNGVQIFSNNQPEYFYPNSIFSYAIFALIICALTIMQRFFGSKIKQLVKRANPTYKMMLQQQESQTRIVQQ